MGLHPLRISRAENDRLFDEEGRSYIDLFSAHGTAWLGHADPDIAEAIASQLGRVWVTGGLETDVAAQARALVEGFFPPSHRLAALYSTGMEAAEFALRVARTATGRNGAVGFARAMHGKSMATAYLGWDNDDDLRLPDFVRLPFVPDRPEAQILEKLADVLASRPISAVFVEPIQGCGGGHSASSPFYREVARLCADHGALLVFDEILTGFYRTGSPFVFSDLGLVPDLILVGKAMGGGFPVSGVVADERYPITKAMLPGSTYAGNPLASAAVVATLTKLRGLDILGRVAAIERAIVEGLSPLERVGVALRGKGALWILELPAGWDVEAVVFEIYRRGVAVGYAGRHLRILPAATIDPGRLAWACAIIREELSRERRHE
jgi:acetylornithine/succinyldiaminopimelate/putrescine aminotransferase